MSYPTLSLKRLCIYKIAEDITSYALDDLPPELKEWIYETWSDIKSARADYFTILPGGDIKVKYYFHTGKHPDGLHLLRYAPK
jgi:hypothetical protein